MKTVALLGGMTFEASILYYNVINRFVRERLGGRYSAPVILHSFNFHPILEAMNRGEWDWVTAQFVSAATHMKASGAQGLVICANYPHKVADVVEEQSGLELLHIADFTAREIVKHKIRKVGLLGMKMVMEEGYIKERIMRKYGIEVIVPAQQQVRDKVHEELMGALPNGVVTEELQNFLVQVSEELVRDGAEGIILGSTDLAFALKSDHVRVPLFDTNKIHATRVASWLLGDL